MESTRQEALSRPAMVRNLIVIQSPDASDKGMGTVPSPNRLWTWRAAEENGSAKLQSPTEARRRQEKACCPFPARFMAY
jgi:hypothetical protein